MASIQNFFIINFLRITGRKNTETDSIETIRHKLDKLTSMAAIPRRVKFEKTECEGMPIEWATPKNFKNKGVVLYLHGGAYVSGSIATHRALVGRIAIASKTKCLAIEYSLAPERPFPHGLNDAIKAYHWLIKQGYDHKKIIVCGDSAGGGLAIATLVKLRDDNAPQPAGAVAISPWLDLLCSGESGVKNAKSDPMITNEFAIVNAKLYGAQNDLKHPYISPLYSDPKGLPPIYIQVSSSEILLDDTLRFEKKAKAAGVDIQVDSWSKMVHVWQAFGPFLPEAMKAIEKMGNYIEKKTK
jgi:monoterpene epsilon-lactone hydrolase